MFVGLVGCCAADVFGGAKTSRVASRGRDFTVSSRLAAFLLEYRCLNYLFSVSETILISIWDNRKGIVMIFVPNCFAVLALTSWLALASGATTVEPDSSISTGECAPVTWELEGMDEDRRRAAPTSSTDSRPTPTPAVPRIPGEDIQPGQINCRWWGATDSEPSCQSLVEEYRIPSVEKFLQLNPILDSDCGNIKPYTEYCTRGFVEPLRAWDGRCGPPNNNATCIGMSMGQCCNSKTWTCGSSITEDCSPGICYEGVCFGHKVYTTDGTCGPSNANRQCAGNDECCSVDGMCGTGEDFCGKGRCQFGNCEEPKEWTLEELKEMFPDYRGTTTDGTCGGERGMKCGVPFGTCCGREGKCGMFEEYCGKGCQLDFGYCYEHDALRTSSAMARRASSASRSSASAAAQALSSAAAESKSAEKDEL